MKTGSSQSIRAALKDIADRENISFQVIITRYLHERLIYRLSVSEYVKNFLLKGGTLLYAFEGIHTRPTMDIDMLAKHIDNDKENIRVIFQKVCQINYPDDCVIFNANSIEVFDIAENDKYSGVRVLLDANFDTVKQGLQIDIGFSDNVMSPVELDFPVLIEELDNPHIMAYSIETVVAEKFHAMIALGTNNSRMKDFYDVFVLLKNNEIADENLQDAIKKTFSNRNTAYIENPELFSELFYTNVNRQIMWRAFLKKIKIENIDFKQVIEYITTKLSPIYEMLQRTNLFL
jgi:predicted nucleotidyltransferase component of viral defense system